MRTVRQIVLSLGMVAVAATWVASSTQLANGILDLAVFIAPGAVIGLLIGWLSHVFTRRTFTWTTGLVSVAAGGIILAPWLAALIVLASIFQPVGLPMLYITGAWVAVLMGLAAAPFLYASGAISSHRERLTSRWRSGASAAGKRPRRGPGARAFRQRRTRSASSARRSAAIHAGTEAPTIVSDVGVSHPMRAVR